MVCHTLHAPFQDSRSFYELFERVETSQPPYTPPQPFKIARMLPEEYRTILKLGHNPLYAHALVCNITGFFIFRSVEEGWVCLDSNAIASERCARRRWKRLGWEEDVLDRALEKDGGEWWKGEDGWRYESLIPLSYDELSMFRAKLGFWAPDWANPAENWIGERRERQRWNNKRQAFEPLAGTSKTPKREQGDA